MAYTKSGPFVNDGAPYLDAPFFNRVEAALNPGTAVNQITGWFHVDQYGAGGNGTTVDRAAIQAAINAANSAYTASGTRQRVFLPPAVYILDAVTYTKTDGTVYGVAGLVLLDGVELYGPAATLKVQAGAYGSGALYGAIRSTSSGITDAAVTGLTIDGNRANQVSSNQCSNIDLFVSANVTVAHVKSIHSNGNAIRLSSGTAQIATNLKILGCTVIDSSYIGIQASHFTGLDIGDFYVSSTGDNGIDVYGENGTTTVDGTEWSIHDGAVIGSTVGIFPETVGNGTVHDVQIDSCTIAGVHLNRINGAPHDNTVHDVRITNTPTGILVTGDMAAISLHDITVDGFTTAGIQLGSGSGNASQVDIHTCYLNPSNSAGTTPLVLFAGNQVAKVRVRGLVTTASNRQYDLWNTATTSSGISYEATYPLDAWTGFVSVASGANLVFNVPKNSGGIITIHGNTGTAYDSMWVGAFSSSGGAVTVTQIATNYTGAGQLITSVTGNTTGISVTVATAATGSTATFGYTIKRTTA